MSFPRYPKYKDSGVEWLGDLPEGWKQLPIWLLFEIGRGRVISHEEIIDNSGEYPVYSSQTESDGIMGCLNTFDFEGNYLTWTTDGANAGTVFRRSGRFNCTNVCGTLKSRSKDVLLDYCRHALAISTASFVRQDINPKLMNNVMAKIRIPIPPIPEQTAIASFLEKETAKIDELVAEQQRLIELLKEKRQAVISHAVTKGLNPDAPMKPSGIEWLGDVPEHWEVKPLKYLVSLTSGGTPSKANLAYWNGAVPWASSKDLKAAELFDTQDHITQKALDERAAELVPPGSILTVVRGMILLHTFPVVITRVPMAINQDLKAILPAIQITTDFLAWLLRGASNEILSRTDEAGHGTKVLRIDTWLAMQVPVPPQKEQNQIVAAITNRLDEIDALTAEAQRAIDLLQERRTALISAAVTGNIDVRGLVKAEAART